jgi:hypothetical protein
MGSIIARTRHCGVDFGVRTTADDVQVDAVGVAAGWGHDLVAQRARVVAW